MADEFDVYKNINYCGHCWARDCCWDLFNGQLASIYSLYKEHVFKDIASFGADREGQQTFPSAYIIFIYIYTTTG